MLIVCKSNLNDSKKRFIFIHRNIIHPRKLGSIRVPYVYVIVNSKSFFALSLRLSHRWWWRFRGHLNRIYGPTIKRPWRPLCLPTWGTRYVCHILFLNLSQTYARKMFSFQNTNKKNLLGKIPTDRVFKNLCVYVF